MELCRDPPDRPRGRAAPDPKPAADRTSIRALGRTRWVTAAATATPPAVRPTRRLVATSDEGPTAKRPHAWLVLIRRRSLGATLGAIRPNDFRAWRTGTDRSAAIMPACGPVRTTLNGLTGIYGSDARAERAKGLVAVAGPCMGHKPRTLAATSGHSRALNAGRPAGMSLLVGRFPHHRPSKLALSRHPRCYMISAEISESRRRR